MRRGFACLLGVVLSASSVLAQDIPLAMGPDDGLPPSTVPIRSSLGAQLHRQVNGPTGGDAAREDLAGSWTQVAAFLDAGEPAPTGEVVFSASQPGADGDAYTVRFPLPDGSSVSLAATFDGRILTTTLEPEPGERTNEEAELGLDGHEGVVQKLADIFTGNFGSEEPAAAPGEEAAEPAEPEAPEAQRGRYRLVVEGAWQRFEAQGTVDPSGPVPVEGFRRPRPVEVNLSVDGIVDADEETRGAVLALNNDNDDFANPPAPVDPQNPHDYQADLDQTGAVQGEDDLQTVTLEVPQLKELKEGQLRLELRGGLKLWEKPTKDTLVLDATTVAKTWTVAEFKRLGQPVRFYLEGHTRSGAVRDARLRLSFRHDEDDAQPAGEDIVTATVVELVLSEEVGTASVLDTFLPGYRGGAPVLTAATQFRQGLRLWVLPLALGKAKDSVANAVSFQLHDTTSLRGVAMNMGRQTGPDFALDPDGATERRATRGRGPGVSSNFYCFDYGGQTRAEARVERGGRTLARCELRIPLDSDRDLLPDAYERAHASDLIRTRLAGAATPVLDPQNPRTPAVAAIAIANHTAGVPAVPAGPAAHWDGETRSTPADTGTVPGGVGGGGPGQGLLGDGLTAYEEYRGFFYGDDANTPNSHRHHRTHPHQQDLFVHSVGVVDGGVDLGIGFLTSLRGGALEVDSHRIDSTEWTGTASREINGNRAEMNLPGWQGPQRALRVVNRALGFYGLSEPGNINTGPDGVCQTVAGLGDQQVIPRNQGQPNVVIIRPGPNGIIDPPMNRADQLDARRHRILPGPDGRLDTVIAGYQPQGDDLVAARIEGGPDGRLDPRSVAQADAQDLQVVRIEGSAADPLDPRTVAGAPGDELARVVLDPRAGGLHAGEVDAADTLNADGTVSPRNPTSGAEDGFQTALGGDDLFRGTILPGPDARLAAVPQGNDVILGTIEAGSDGNLQSRPRGNDWAVGEITAGPNGKLDPQLNNGTATISGTATAPPNDDRWIAARDEITTGLDGIRHTNPQPGSDDVAERDIPDGRGMPGQLCVDGDDGDANFPENADLTIVPAAGDDVLERTPGAFNESPNEHDEVIVDVAVHSNLGVGWNRRDESHQAGMPTAVNAYPDITLPAALRSDDADYRPGQAHAGQRHNLIRESIAHECGHAVHVDHYFTDVLPGPWRLGVIAGPTGHGEPWAAQPARPDAMCSNDGTPVPNAFDACSLRQMRIHLKH